MTVLGMSPRMRRRMVAFVSLLSWKSVPESPSPIRFNAP